MHYFNEHDPHAAQWLRNLMDADLIPRGEVDERSITDVTTDDLRGFVQCHFFAGIGGWSLALRLAGWPDERHVWTGSCPCQPFSAVGKQKAQADERHLWPEMFRLVRECRPDVCFGEQVPGAIGHGWLDGISADLEGAGYAVGSVVLGAHSVGAPHIRQRLYWVADSQGERWCRWSADSSGKTGGNGAKISGLARGVGDARPSPSRPDGTGTGAGPDQQRNEASSQPRRRRKRGGMAHADGGQSGDGELQRGGQQRCESADGGTARGVEHAASDGRDERRAGADGRGVACGCGDCGMGHAVGPRPQGHAGDGDDGNEPGRIDAHAVGPTAATGRGSWSSYTLWPCGDGKTRRVESGLLPLVDGLPFLLADGRTREGVSRTQVLRGIGNAIVPEDAAAFVMAFQKSSRR